MTYLYNRNTVQNYEYFRKFMFHYRFQHKVFLGIKIYLSKTYSIAKIDPNGNIKLKREPGKVFFSAYSE